MIRQISLEFRAEVYTEVKSVFHRVQMVFGSPRLDEHAEGVDVDGE